MADNPVCQEKQRNDQLEHELAHARQYIDWSERERFNITEHNKFLAMELTRVTKERDDANAEINELKREREFKSCHTLDPCILYSQFIPISGDEPNVLNFKRLSASIVMLDNECRNIVGTLGMVEIYRRKGQYYIYRCGFCNVEYNCYDNIIMHLVDCYAKNISTNVPIISLGVMVAAGVWKDYRLFVESCGSSGKRKREHKKGLETANKRQKT